MAASLKKIRILELFGGIGACSKALERLGIDYEIADYVEIDKYAVKSFNAIHGTNFEPQDITKWDKDIDVDLIMHGSPCQDFSVAGLGKGGDKGSGTRSSLMYETLRIVTKLKPKYVIWENVKNLLSAKHRPNFEAYQKAMADLGYKNFVQVLNAKDFGVPQNRERVFTVSILREDSDPKFEFPSATPLTKRLKDILEDKVDESFYLSDDRVKKIKLWENRQKENGRGFRFEPKSGDDVAQTVSTAVDRPSSGAYYKEPQSALVQPVDRDYNKHGGKRETQIEVKGDGMSHNLRTNGETLVAEPTTKRLTGLYDKPGSKHQAGSIYDTEGTAPTLSTMQGGNLEPLIPEPKIIDDTYANRDAREYEQVSPTLRAHRSGLKVLEEPYVVASRGRVPKGSQNGCEGANTAKKYEQSYEPNTDGTTNTLTSVQKDNLVAEPSFRIRKLTPKECYRLMGFDDLDFEKAEKVNSNSQLYKQAGNSIVVNVLETILKELING